MASNKDRFSPYKPGKIPSTRPPMRGRENRLMGPELALYEIFFAKGWNSATDKSLIHWKFWRGKLLKCKSPESAYSLGVSEAEDYKRGYLNVVDKKTSK